MTGPAETIVRRRVLAGIAVFAFAVLAFRLLRSAAGYWTIDDAAITHASAFELVDHGTLAMYPEGTPVESYSNPLVYFVTALLHGVGLFDPIATHLLLETAVFAIMIVLVWSLLRAWTGSVAAVGGAVVFAVLELVTPATWVWYGSGLENVWVSAGLVVMLWLCARTARGARLSPAWGIVLGLAALTRPEAPVHVAAGYIALFAIARPADRSWRDHAWQVGQAAAITAAMFVGFMAWRRIGYGDWLPNTYYAKLGTGTQLVENVRHHVLRELPHYYRIGVFAASAVVLVALPRLRVLGACTLVLIAASLALPATAGNDLWLGHVRFATALLCMVHAAYAILLAACIAQIAGGTVSRLRRIAPLVAACIPLVLLARDPIAIVKPVWLNDVTVGRVAQLHGAQRWEQQMRVGVPFPVVMAPDAGGSLLVGAMQLVDNASLSDYQMAHMARDQYRTSFGVPMMNQYEHAERMPDLVSPQTSGVLDSTYLGTRYLPGAGYLYARRDLVEAQLPDHARALFDDGSLRIYLSGRTVPVAAPGALVRCELLVAWSTQPPDETTRVRATLLDDIDEISLAPYAAEPNRVERRGLLLGTPTKPGAYAIAIEIERAGQTVFRGPLITIEVTRDAAAFTRAALASEAEPSPPEAALRLAWVREQTAPRLPMRTFGAVSRSLLKHHMTSRRVGRYVLRLRDNARLATFGDVSPALRAAELRVMHRMAATCPAATDDRARVTRALCLGRTIDRLRRWGYLGALARLTTVPRELRDARSLLPRLERDERYRLLVGLTLADPTDMALQRELTAARREVAQAGAFPTL